MGKQTTKLTGTEWALLRDIAARMQIFLIDDLSTSAVLWHIVERTLAWKRFSTELVAVHLTKSDPVSHSYGVPLCRAAAYRGLETLVERGIVYSQKRKTLRTLTINWPAILRRHIDQLESLDITVNTKRLESLLTTITKEFDSMGLKSRHIAFTRELKTKELEESFTLGDETHAHEEAKKTRQKKAKLTLAEKKPIDTLTVHAYREQYETISREENRPPFPWQSKDYGQVKNYLAECKREGRDPVQILRICLLNWSKIARYLGQMMDDRFISDGMDWKEFYAFRGHIYDWIWYTKGGLGEESDAHHTLVWQAMADNGTPVDYSPESHRIEVPLLTEHIKYRG
jgi:hypothetical protein